MSRFEDFLDDNSAAGERRMASDSTAVHRPTDSGGAGGLAGRPRQAVRESLGLPLILYFIGLVVVLTLVPFNFSWPDQPRLNFRFFVDDIVSNLFLFAPLGFIVRLCLDRSRAAWHTAAVSLFFGSAIEILQLFLPTRVTSPQDVASNVLGAWVGALACDAIVSHLDARVVRDLVLELPLVTLFYLLVPLLWLNSLLGMTHPFQVDRAWATVPIGVIGGIIAGSVGYHRLGPRGLWGPPGVLGAVVLWLVAANAINLVRDPRTTLLACSIAVVVVGLLLSVSKYAFGTSRRFEQPVLLRILPFYLAYLLLTDLVPFVRLGDEWRWKVGFEGLDPNPNGVSIGAALAIVEQIVAYSILGYIIAGLRGRTGESRASMLGWVAFTCGLVAAACEGLRGFHPAHAASLGEWFVAVIASVYGAYLYRMHLRTVWRILGRLPAG